MPDLPALATLSLTLLLAWVPRAIWLLPDWLGKWLDLRDRWQDRYRDSRGHPPST